MLFIQSRGKWAVFETSHHIPAHAKLQINALEIDETAKFALYCFFDRLQHLSILVLLEVLCEYATIDTHECGVCCNFQDANVLQVILVKAALYEHSQWLNT